MSAEYKIFSTGFLMAWVMAAAEPNSTGREAVCARGEAAQGWTIPYGKEFWRRPDAPAAPKYRDANPPSAMTLADIDLGDIMDRVSHAISDNDASAVPRVQAKTYTAACDETGFRFSPHQPGTPFPEKELKGLRSPAHQGLKKRTMRMSYPLPDPDTEVMLRTASVRLGNRFLYERNGRSLNWSLFGNTAQALLDERLGLVEHYEAGGDGLQVSWVLMERPGAGI